MSMVRSDTIDGGVLLAPQATYVSAVPVVKEEVFASYHHGDNFFKVWIYNDCDKIQIKILN